jgi:hypothetical protein
MSRKTQKFPIHLDVAGVADLLNVPTKTVALLIEAGENPPAVWPENGSGPLWGATSLPKWLRIMDQNRILTTCGLPPRRKKMSRPYELLAVQVDPALKKRLHETAWTERRSLSNLVRDALVEYLNRRTPDSPASNASETGPRPTRE